ncbi:unnamed protein product [marine sediment metagenome]|uniref:Chromosomal replication initiator DnaA C-terminal domain-containing protein n=1 Tax=marine sediment metagenome TaxID=412755 RepID=X0SJB1_9ZZZZ
MVDVAVQAALGEREASFIPLVFIGEEGVGKSHLAQGLAHCWQQRGCGGRVVCTSGSDFARGLASAIDAGKVASFRTRHREASLLVLEDLSALAGKTAALQELIFTLDALEERGAAVVVTSRRPPDEIRHLPGALVSRLSAGLVLTLAPAGVEARKAMLNELATRRGVSLSGEAAQLLARELRGGVPQLLEALLETAGGGSVVEAESVRRYLATHHARKPPSVPAITAAVAKSFSLKTSQLKGALRNRSVVTARGIAMYLARDLTDRSLKQIGRSFGGRDHTTVLHHCRKVETLVRSDPAVRQMVTTLRESLT